MTAAYRPQVDWARESATMALVRQLIAERDALNVDIEATLLDGAHWDEVAAAKVDVLKHRRQAVDNQIIANTRYLVAA